MVDDELFVGVDGNVFDIELGVEFRGDGWRGTLVGEEDEVCCWELEVVLFVAVRGEGFWGEDFGGRVGLLDDVSVWHLDGG